MRRTVLVAVALGAAALPAATAGGSPRARSSANALCLKLRTADPAFFRQLFIPRPASTPDSARLSFCSQVQSHRARCRATTTLDANARDRLSYSLGCLSGPSAARTPGVTQFALLLNRTFTALGPVTIGSSIGPSAGFACGVREYPGRSSLICVRGFIAYGKQGVSTTNVTPNTTCSVRGLYAVRTATGAWDIYTLARAPHVINGAQCPAPHF